MNADFHFRKNEKLKDPSAIESLFENGRKVQFYPLLFIYGALPSTEEPVEADYRCAFTVSKRKFRRATDRNRIKRIMREAYRLQKHLLYQHLQAQHISQMGIVILYLGKEIPEYKVIFDSVNRFISKFSKP